MKTNDETKNEGAFKPRKNRRWMIHVIYLAIFIAILLLLKCCSDKKEKEHEAEKLSWLQKEDSLKSKNFGLGKENDSLKWRTWELEYSNDSLKSRIEELENRKATPIFKEGIKDGKSGKWVLAIIVPLNDPRKSTLFIEDCLPVPECPPCPEIRDSCIVDDFSVTIAEIIQDSSKNLFDSKGKRLFPVYDVRGYKPDLKSKSSCFDIAPSEQISYSHTINQISVNNDLIKRAKTKHWIATGGRLLSMAGYAWLHHSDKQFAITYNGIPPYDSNNPYKTANDSDERIAGQKAWAERGIWLLYGGSEALDYSATRDFMNAYSLNKVTLTFDLNFGK